MQTRICDSQAPLKTNHLVASRVILQILFFLFFIFFLWHFISIIIKQTSHVVAGAGVVRGGTMIPLNTARYEFRVWCSPPCATIAMRHTTYMLAIIKTKFLLPNAMRCCCFCYCCCCLLLQCLQFAAFAGVIALLSCTLRSFR